MFKAFFCILVALISCTRALSSKIMSSTQTRGQVLGYWWTSKFILNAADTPASADAGAAKLDAVALAKKMRFKMLGLKGDFMSDAGDKVDYKNLKISDSYKEYLAIVSALQDIKLCDLTESSRKGFLINVYNCMCIHALAEGRLGGFPGGSLSRLKLYASSSYCIGGQNYSLNDIENGLLRGNKASAAPFSKPPFANDDPRLSDQLTCDPRIHFALNCGALSCPPIAVYSVDDDKKLEDQLSTATQGFLEGKENLQWDEEKGELRLSMLFQWYASDFGDGDAALVQWVLDHAPEPVKTKLTAFLKACPEPKIKFLEYNWGINE